MGQMKLLSRGMTGMNLIRVVSNPRNTRGETLLEMGLKSRPKDTPIRRQNSCTERIEFTKLSIGLSMEFSFIGTEIGSMTLMIAKRPQFLNIVQK